MKRDIKFRGLRVDGKGWVYGYVSSWEHFNGKGYEDSTAIEVPNDKKYLVIPESVGQYTGLTDSRRIAIYEGDIVELENLPEWGAKRHMQGVGLVTWRGRDACFVAIKDMFGYMSLTWSGTESIHVIGNIHENPELINQAAATI